MDKVAMLNQKMNLATLGLRLCEEMEEHYAGSGYQVKPMPKDEAFEKDVAIGEDIYRALYKRRTDSKAGLKAKGEKNLMKMR